MQEDLHKLTQNFDQKFKSFETSILSKLSIDPQPLIESSVTAPSYAETLRKNIKIQAQKKTVQVPSTSFAPRSQTVAVQQPATPTIIEVPSTSNTTTEQIDADELRQRERKRLNVVLYRLPESDNLNESAAYQEDVLKLKDVFFEKEGFNPEHVKRVFRIGEKSDDKTRPIRIVFTDDVTRSNVIAMTDLTYENSSDTVKLFISEDRTKNQITQHKLLVQQLKMRQETGESDLIIRNGSIVKKRPFRPSPQSVWAQSEA